MLARFLLDTRDSGTRMRRCDSACCNARTGSSPSPSPSFRSSACSSSCSRSSPGACSSFRTQGSCSRSRSLCGSGQQSDLRRRYVL